MTATNVRIPNDLHQRVKDEAQRDRRSNNAEIITLLEEALKERDSKKIEPPR